MQQLSIIDSFKGNWKAIEHEKAKHLKELRKIATIERINWYCPKVSFVARWAKATETASPITAITTYRKDTQKLLVKIFFLKTEKLPSSASIFDDMLIL